MTDAPDMPEVIWAIRSDADNTILYGFTYPSPANGIDNPYTLQVTHEAAQYLCLLNDELMAAEGGEG